MQTDRICLTILLSIFQLLQAVENINSTHSQKKGLVIPAWPRHMCGDFEAFDTVSWWYNYHTYPDPEDITPWWCSCADTGRPPKNRSECMPADPTITFIPEVYGIPGLGQRPDDHEPPIDDVYQYVLGYNEPNQAGQSNIPPEVAAEAFAELTKTYPDKIFVFPATAGPNTQWMDPFLEACEELGCKIDYIGMHDYSGDADHVMKRVKNFSQRYGKQIWLTEFAVNNEHSEEKVINFIESLLPQLEQSEAVFRYSWYYTRYYPDYDDSTSWWIDPINSLLEQNSPTLSKVGKAYNKPWHLFV